MNIELIPLVTAAIAGTAIIAFDLICNGIKSVQGYEPDAVDTVSAAVDGFKLDWDHMCAHAFETGHCVKFYK